MQRLQTYRKLPPSLPAHNKGFSLLEILLASVLGIIVATAAGKGYYSTMQLKKAAVERTELQQDLRVAADLLTHDAHMAGRFGCFNVYEALYNKNNQESSGAHAGKRKMQDSEWNKIRNPQQGGYIEDLNKSSFGVNDLFQLIPDNKWLSGRIAAIRKLGTGHFSQYFPPFRNKNYSETLIFIYGEHSLNSKDKPVVYSTCSTLSILKDDASTDLDAAFNHMVSQFPQKTIHKNEVSVMNYIINAYTVGNVNGAKGLYRLQLEKNGNKWNWSSRQLLAKGIKNLNFQAVFAQNCPAEDSKTATASETFTYGINGGEAINDRDPALIRLHMLSEEDKVYTINALVRNANYCANRRK